jgi:hypothetical protein
MPSPDKPRVPNFPPQTTIDRGRFSSKPPYLVGLPPRRGPPTGRRVPSFMAVRRLVLSWLLRLRRSLVGLTDRQYWWRVWWSMVWMTWPQSCFCPDILYTKIRRPSPLFRCLFVVPLRESTTVLADATAFFPPDLGLGVTHFAEWSAFRYQFCFLPTAGLH